MLQFLYLRLSYTVLGNFAHAARRARKGIDCNYLCLVRHVERLVRDSCLDTMLPTLVAAPFALLFAAIQQTNINYIAELFVQSKVRYMFLSLTSFMTTRVLGIDHIRSPSHPKHSLLRRLPTTTFIKSIWRRRQRLRMRVEWLQHRKYLKQPGL